jgi:hypothetical protein|tara:strand:+ start:6297 stop:6746 length:450 start_codon:yes stop_codon:yes gene_type:complete
MKTLVGMAGPLIVVLLSVGSYAADQLSEEVVEEESMSEIGNLFIALKVNDAEASAEFYKGLGFTPTDEARWTKDYASFNYQGTSIALMTFIPQTVLLNLEQTDQEHVDALGERLRNYGMSVQPAGAENKGFYLEDPDGTGLYIFTEAKP